MDPHRKITCPKGAEFFDLWVHDCTQGVKGYLMNFHGPRTRKYLTYRQGNFHYRVQDCSLGLYYTQCIFMDPQIKTSWPKGQEVFHYWVHDSTSVSNMSLSKSQCTLMDPKITQSHVESWLPNLMYHSGPLKYMSTKKLVQKIGNWSKKLVQKLYRYTYHRYQSNTKA